MLLDMLWLLLGITGLLMDHNKTSNGEISFMFYYISKTIPTRVFNNLFLLITTTQQIV